MSSYESWRDLLFLAPTIGVEDERDDEAVGQVDVVC